MFQKHMHIHVTVIIQYQHYITSCCNITKIQLSPVQIRSIMTRYCVQRTNDQDRTKSTPRINKSTFITSYGVTIVRPLGNIDYVLQNTQQQLCE